jgi:hypothetical protein
MKQRMILYGLTLVLGCFVLASCINDAEGPCLPDGKTQVVFSLVLPDNAQTRAMWSANSDWINGEEKDNDIDLSTIRIVIFDNAGTYVGTLGDELTYLPKETGTTPYEKTVYECIGTVPEAIATKLTSAEVKNFKFVVFANCTVPESITWDGLKTAVVFDSETDKIPMWGVISVENLTLKKGERTPLGDIVLLRSLSKVTVALTGTDATKMSGFEFISSVKVTNYNTSGYVVPTLPAYASVTNTMALDDETCVNAATTGASTGLVIEGSTETTELTFWLLEFVNKGKEDAAQAQLIVTLGKNVEDAGTGEVTVATKEFDFAPIKFCAYENGAPTTTAYDIVRNHYYKFNITEVAGELYVYPIVADWIDAPELTYNIGMSTNIRLFDSWLYRYDLPKEGETAPDYDEWDDSHMVVSTGFHAATDVEPAGRPERSPMIQLVTTGDGTFNLTVDNPNFEIIYVEKDDDTGKTTAYTPKGQTLTINPSTDPDKEEVTTYFYIVPTSSASVGSTAHVFLYYNDPITGKLEVPYNYNALPGWSDDSSEFWVYYASDTDYDAEDNPFMKMYYQDAAHPLVPVPTVNP